MKEIKKFKKIEVIDESTKRLLPRIMAKNFGF